MIDLELIKELKLGNEVAFKKMVDILQPELLRFAFMLCKNKELSLDLCQDCFVTVHQKVNTLKDEKNFKSWVFKVLKNKYLDYSKSPKNATTEDIVDWENTVFEQSSEDKLYALQKLEKILSQFDTDEKELILLVNLQGLSFREIAESWNMSENSIKTRYYRLIKKIEK